MQYLKADTSITTKMGPFLDETDGKTAETGLTITQPDVRLSKNGGDFAQKAAAETLSHDEFGWYDLTLDGTDTNTEGRLVVAIHESGALPVWREFMVVNANVYDSLFAAATTDYLQVDTTQVEGGDATDGIRDSVVDDATRIDASTLNTLSSNDPGSQLAAQTDVTGLNDLSSANITTACNNSLTAYDSPTKAELDAGLAALNDITVAQVLAGIVEETYDVKEVLRIMLAVLAGKSSGGGTVTLTFRDVADSKNRITATVNATGDRTAITLDES